MRPFITILFLTQLAVALSLTRMMPYSDVVMVIEVVILILSMVAVLMILPDMLQES